MSPFHHQYKVGRIKTSYKNIEGDICLVVSHGEPTNDSTILKFDNLFQLGNSGVLNESELELSEVFNKEVYIITIFIPGSKDVRYIGMLDDRITKTHLLTFSMLDYLLIMRSLYSFDRTKYPIERLEQK